MRNVKLRSAIFEEGKTIQDVAKAAKINRAYLSLHLHGRVILKPDEKRRIAEVLRRPVSELFAEGVC